ncbi:Uncharacterised protein [Leminorella richardii]|uniref:Metal-dependent hydrolase n=1 Tax=Leminorella richardii TaxID=158841 RepID=A0A2X4U362_9GAMM|nr:metal-dependent hydrolase [Leminorella richardii]SQI34267.1 Uncharacterised protein [Leminorella richardii]
MFIAHLPTGYLIGTALIKAFNASEPQAKRILVACMLGAIAPDFDLFYFYLIDHRLHQHHTYVTHFPILWFGLLTLALVWLSLASRKSTALLAVVFCLNGAVHLLLDSVVGNIWWLMPFVDQPYSLFHIEAMYHPWWLNFILNWSFALEVILVSAAVWRWR